MQFNQNNYNDYGSSSYQYENQGVSLAEYSRRVYSFMFSGLLITFAISFIMLMNRERVIEFIYYNYGAYMILLLLELVVVIALGFSIRRVPAGVCTALFIGYSILNGFTIAPALIIYGVANAVYAFAVTAVVFGAMTVYGMTTKRDLTRLGPVLLIGLVCLIVYSVIALFFNMPLSDLIISIIGIVIFVGFTAYDTQKIKRFYYGFNGNGEMLRKTAIVIALELYLDFINLFLYVLRLFGRR